MATITQHFTPEMAQHATSAIAPLNRVGGTNFPVTSLAFSATQTERVYFQFHAIAYGSGNLTVKLLWYADNATSGDVVWETALAAITPNTDTTDVETKAFASAQTGTDSHLGTTGQRVHSHDLTVSNLDSLASGDYAMLRISRLGADAGDTMSNDALLAGVVLTYSDT